MSYKVGALAVHRLASRIFVAGCHEPLNSCDLLPPLDGEVGAKRRVG
jgi:hypothetical protein